jgi:thiosulfate dehydrogenase [quinone] large subunit
VFIQFLRDNLFISYVLTGLRIYLGWTWFSAGWGKITGTFDASGFLNGALSKTNGEHPAVQSWWGTFIDSFALPNVHVFNVLIPWGEFFVGLALLLGTFTTFVASMGVLMNFSYLLSGTTSINPQMVIMEILILIAGYNAAKIGLDRWIIPFVRKQLAVRQGIELSP